MIQNILTGITILAAVAYTMYRIYRLAGPDKEGLSGECAGCPGCSLNPKLMKRPAVGRYFVSNDFFS